MATIALYSSKINQMPSLVRELRGGVSDYHNSLAELQRKSLSIDRSVCDLDEVISELRVSSRTQEERVDALDRFQEHNQEFIDDTIRIDYDVAETVDQTKDNFYEKYDYLKPDCERAKEGFFQKAGRWLSKAGEWCKENWESLVQIVAVVIIAVAVVALCIVSFGTATPVLIALGIGALVGVLGQLGSDLVSFAITGQWNGTWQSYVGAAFGGAVGGVVALWTGNATAASAVSSGLQTFFTQHLENLTGGQKRSSLEILFNTGVDSALAAIFSKAFDKLSTSFSKYLSKHFSMFRRFSGRGSYGAAFNMVLTKLKNHQIKNFSFKTIRNGIIDGLQGSFFENIFSGFKDGVLSLLRLN